jgi:hypothetical protein
MTYPSRIGGSSFRMPYKFNHDLATDPENTKYPVDIDTYGYRLLKLLSQVKELTEPVQDPKLKKLINRTSEVTRAEMLVRFWHRIGRKVINKQGGYKPEGAEGTEKGLKDLLFVRTHPEMQFLYKYKSPSGYLNQSKEE